AAHDVADFGRVVTLLGGQLSDRVHDSAPLVAGNELAGERGTNRNSPHLGPGSRLCTRRHWARIPVEGGIALHASDSTGTVGELDEFLTETIKFLYVTRQGRTESRDAACRARRELVPRRRQRRGGVALGRRRPIPVRHPLASLRLGQRRPARASAGGNATRHGGAWLSRGERARRARARRRLPP